MTYYRGTLAQFTDWETSCRVTEGIPLDGSGKVNQVNGVDAPNNQKTIEYCKCIPNPNDAQDVMWIDSKYPPQGVGTITHDEAITIGFIQEINE